MLLYREILKKIDTGVPEWTPCWNYQKNNKKINNDEILERIVNRYTNNTSVCIKHGERPFYYLKDYITMPYDKNFKSKKNYYYMVLHEIAHSTGHKSRLNRFKEKPTQLQYAGEECVATLTSLLILKKLNKINKKLLVKCAAYIKMHITEAGINDKKQFNSILEKAQADAEQAAQYILKNANMENV